MRDGRPVRWVCGICGLITVREKYRYERQEASEVALESGQESVKPGYAVGEEGFDVTDFFFPSAFADEADAYVLGEGVPAVEVGCLGFAYAGCD